MTTFGLYWREILYYFYIRRTIKKEKKKGDIWNTLRLRADWVGRIYTVINLRKEDVGEEDLVKRAKIADKIKPINDYLVSLDMTEIVFPAIQQLSDQSFLIVYSPIFRKFTWIRTIWYLIVLGAIITGAIYGIKLL